MDRRTFLALCMVALGTAGCTGGPGDLEPGPKPPDDPDAALRADVAGSESALIALYATTLAAHPQLAAALAPLQAHHEAHLARVGVDAGEVTAIPSPGPALAVRESLAALAEAEGLARAQRIVSCDAAASRSLARDLTLIAASEAQHAAVLADLAGARLRDDS